MNSFEEIRRALGRLSISERRSVIDWMEEYNASILSAGKIEDAAPAHRPVSMPVSIPVSTSDYMTLEEFFEFEDQGSVLHEYINGVIRPLGDSTVSHGELMGNVMSAIWPRRQKGSCRPFANKLAVRLALGSEQVVYRPDVFVACQREDWEERCIPNPKFVVEVLSPSTEHIDRREKVVNYRRTTSVEEYVIVSQAVQEVLIYRRASAWIAERVVGPDGMADFRSLGISVPLAEIYDNVLCNPPAPGE
jgi:Uma2 family endonuclease